MTNDEQSLVKEQDGAKPFVLIIDDQPGYAKLFDLLSDSLGITTHIANSCEEGITALKEHSFDVIIMDWLMPDVDGPECSCKIRNIEKTTGGHIPIIGVSGSVRANRKECLAAGMDDYLEIPFTLEELHNILSKWLKKKE